MNTIMALLEIASLSKDEGELVKLIDDEADACATAGDVLGAGEWYASRLAYCSEAEANHYIARIITDWASSVEVSFSPANMGDLLANIHYFVADDVATAVAGLVARGGPGIQRFSPLLNDLAYRVSEPLERIFRIRRDRPLDLCRDAATRLRSLVDQALEALRLFRQSKCISARHAGIEVVKKTRQLKPVLLPRERPLMSQVEILLGGAFREFCQAYERGDTAKIVSRINDIRKQAQEESDSNAHASSVFWRMIVRPLADHLITLTDEAGRSSKIAIAPKVKLVGNIFKVDLTRPERAVEFTARLINEGSGSARKVRLETNAASLEIGVVSPRDTFDLAAGSERLIMLKCTTVTSPPTLSIPITWKCIDISGEGHVFTDVLRLEQQRKQPDWRLLIDEPPYTVNPIKSRDRLFGRDAQLNDLLLNSAAGSSTFVWGQKRVGKTSLLQVVMNELSRRVRFACLFLRMGELAGMHEGQIAYTIATRLLSRLPACSLASPVESDFGAGLGKLVPIFEVIAGAYPDWRFVVTIDEFDDLDPAFYTGERGRLFVKALRSLSEIGVTFLFAGSERMNVIYAKHALELNKWTNMFVDCIKSRQDCRDLIVTPLQNMIDYEAGCVDAIAEYCSGNPFFMHLVCQALFKQCVAESRTYISSADFDSQRSTLAETLGQTNFAHLWQDNQILDKDENARFSAENCLVLCCIGSLRSHFTSSRAVWEQQDTLNMTSTERLSMRELSTVIERLRTRKIIADPQEDGEFQISLAIFADWLHKNAELHLLPIWRKFAAEKAMRPQVQQAGPAVMTAPLDSHFPISEDDLLPLSQKLVFCGKQKDVAEIRVWLRQFDDDNRIEIAFLLLKRLAEKGYVSDGAREYALSKVIDAVNARRLELGAGKWNVARARKDNLCISYVDSELKSGATLARELSKRLNPGKAGAAEEVSTWLKSRLQSDPMLVLVDDFSATGSSIVKGLHNWKLKVGDARVLGKFLDEGRVMFAVLYAFGQALDQVREAEPKLRLFPANVFGSEVRAFDSDAGIFDSTEEVAFAREIMLQIGRELTPQTPLGFGDQSALVVFHDTVPNNTLPIFWSNGRVNERSWMPLFSRA